MDRSLNLSLQSVVLSEIGIKDLGRCDVLILEDEPLMAALITRYLGTLPQGLKGLVEAKLNVLTLSSGFELLTADLSKVKVAIVDILLPQVTGVDLIRDFRQRFPQLGLVPISGMATEPMKRGLKELLPAPLGLLDKPFRKEDFSAAFRDAWNHHHALPGSQAAKPAVKETHEHGDGEAIWSVGSSSSKPVAELRRNLAKKAA